MSKEFEAIQQKIITLEKQKDILEAKISELLEKKDCLMENYLLKEKILENSEWDIEILFSHSKSSLVILTLICKSQNDNCYDNLSRLFESSFHTKKILNKSLFIYFNDHEISIRTDIENVNNLRLFIKTHKLIIKNYKEQDQIKIIIELVKNFKVFKSIIDNSKNYDLLMNELEKELKQ